MSEKLDKFRYFSINQLSKVTGKDRATITARLANVKPFKEDGRAKIYDAHEVLEIIYASDTRKGLSAKIETVSYEIEKEKLNKIRIDNERQMGLLVPISEVAETVEKEYTYVRMQLKALPSKLTKPLSLESDPTKVNHILTDHVNECLSELVSDENYKLKMAELHQIEDERTKANSTTESTSEQS